MESYAEFMDRICSFEKPHFELSKEYFKPSNSVLEKVGENNSFSRFYGDTVVFDLDDVSKNVINNMVDVLYSKAPRCFCERLKLSTIHMTLHDLTNGLDMGAISDKIDENYKKIEEIARSGQIYPDYICMKSNYIINMVNTSVVLCFYPANENEYLKIMRLYSMIDEIVGLPYPFTPHITLAYYNRNGFGEEDILALEDAVNSLNLARLEIVLDTKKLFYQRFNDMNHFFTICGFV